MEQLFVIKIGGNVIDTDDALDAFLKNFAAIKGKKILIHGGGKDRYKDRRPVRDRIEIYQWEEDHRCRNHRPGNNVYGGLVNKKIVAKLQSLQCNAIGLTGADANIVPATKRPVKEIDYGFVGDIAIEELGFANLSLFLMSNLNTHHRTAYHDGRGQILNTNADTIASSIAVANVIDL